MTWDTWHGTLAQAEGPLEIKVQHLFSAPFLNLMWKDVEGLNAELRRVILERRARHPSMQMTNSGGWQSAKDLTSWDEPAVRELQLKMNVGVFLISSECFGEETIMALPDKWRIDAWANVNERGDYNNLHNHGGGIWSGVYYVDAGEEAEAHSQSGVIAFCNPTLAPLAVDNLHPPDFVKAYFRSNYSLRPRSGEMLIFPSWLQHHVHPHHGDAPRISVSWDVVFPGGA